MSTTTLPAPVRPDPAEVGPIAARIHAAIRGDSEYPRLIDGCGRYNSDWTCTTGTLAIARWNQAADAVPLLEEAVRALALKAAVYALTEDEETAELPIARPVDEVVHAVLAQRTLTERLAERCGFAVIHMTDTEQQPSTGDYEPGGYTWSAYLAAFGCAPATRYWLGAKEHQRRVTVLSDRLAEVGLYDQGRRHNLEFASAG